MPADATLADVFVTLRARFTRNCPAGWGLLIVGGVAGLSKVIGTRLLDFVVAGLQRSIGQ